MTVLRVEPVALELMLPPGALGPDAVKVDVRCFVVVNADGIQLIDTGPPGSSAAIGAVLEGTGASWSDVSDILLTHSHFDHTGGVAEAAAFASRATVRAGAADAPEIVLDRPGGIRPVMDGDRLGELLVLHTPGHTAGHVSLLHEATKVVVIGDVVGNLGGTLSFGPPAFNADLAQSRRSLERIADLRPDRVLFSHGPELVDPEPALRRLLTRPDGEPAPP